LEEKFFVKGKIVFANLLEPKFFQDGVGKYSIRLMVDKSDLKSCTNMQQYYQRAVAIGATLFVGNDNIMSPIKEGLNYYGTSYSNYYVLDLNTKIQPQIIDINKTLLPLDRIKSGAYVCVAMNFFPYNVNGKCGVSARLYSMMFIRQEAPVITEVSNALEDFATFNLEE